MIVCHCNVITREEIENAIVELLSKDPWRLVVPLQVYHALERRGRCCGCFPNVTSIIVETAEAFHRGLLTPEPDIVDFSVRLSAEQVRIESQRREAARRLEKMKIAG